MVVVVVAFLFGQGLSPNHIQARLAGYDSNGFVRVSVENRSDKRIYVGTPRVEVKGSGGWTNHVGSLGSHCDLASPTEAGEDAPRLSHLPAGDFTWRATVNCEVLKPTPWKSAVNKMLAKLNLPRIADSRIISVTTPEYRRVFSSSSAAVGAQ